MDLTIRFNNTIIQNKSLVLIIGLCTYSGGGMRLTLNSQPTDKQFDISYISKITPLQLLLNIFNLYNGRLAKQNFIKTYKCDFIRVECDSSTQFIIQADGEIIGSGNFTVVMQSDTVQFIIPR